LGTNWDGRSVNEYQSIPIKVNGFNDEKIVMISCGYFHSMAHTESGRVFIWGSISRIPWRSSYLPRWNVPTSIEVKDKNEKNLTFIKINCGHSHSLLLSSDGDIYVFGKNNFGQLGVLNYRRSKVPQKVSHERKFIGIKSHFLIDISIALSENNFFYI
jgi:alpha-tubulin suppressor-like RCC1 family protein